MRNRVKHKTVKVKQHDVECSLLEGILTRGDRRVAPALEEAWRRGARLDGWSECFKPDIWWQTFADLGIDVVPRQHLGQRPGALRVPGHVEDEVGDRLPPDVGLEALAPTVE